EGMQEITKELGGEIRKTEGVAHMEVWNGASNRVNHGHFLVQLLPQEERRITQDQVIARVRAILAGHPAYRPSITMRTALGGGEQNTFPIQANLVGPDMNVLIDYSLLLVAQAQQLKSLAEPKVQLNMNNPELHVAVDRRRAADLGISMATVGNTLRLMVAGDDQISRYREGT